MTQHIYRHSVRVGNQEVTMYADTPEGAKDEAERMAEVLRAAKEKGAKATKPSR